MIITTGLPKTAEALLDRSANIVVPESSHISGYPILLDKKGMEYVLSQKNFKAAQRAVRESDLSVEAVRVNDSGIMLKSADMTHKKRLIQTSYSAAWNILNRVEDELGFPLVTRIRGGSAGSGSILTRKGRALMDAYDQFTEEINRNAQSLYRNFFHDFPELN